MPGSRETLTVEARGRRFFAAYVSIVLHGLGGEARFNDAQAGMEATSIRSVFFVSLTAGVLAAAGVLVSGEATSGPQTCFVLPDQAPQPVGVRHDDIGVEIPSVVVVRRPQVIVARGQAGRIPDAATTADPPRTLLRLAVASADEATADNRIVLVQSRQGVEEEAAEKSRRPEVVPDAPLPPQPVSPVATDVESRNWSEVPPKAADGMPRLGMRPDVPRAGAVREWIRGRLRTAGRSNSGSDASSASVEDTAASVAPGQPWLDPVSLREQLASLGGEPHREWASATISGIEAVTQTPGPCDPSLSASIDALDDVTTYGMQVADADTDLARGSQARRAALAVSRRIALWQAAAESCRLGGVSLQGDVVAMLTAVERFEAAPSVITAAEARTAMERVESLNLAGVDLLAKAFHDHYMAPNVRIAVTNAFADRLMPEPVVENSPLAETILGRDVRGTQTVKRSTRVVFVPDARDIRLDLEVQGDVFARTVTDAGPVLVNSNSTSTFTVRKPIKLSSLGLMVGDARAAASNRSQVAGMQTSFDAIPLMGPLVRTIARNQQQSAMPEANREAVRKIISRACRDVDAQSEPQLVEIEQRVAEKVWQPLQRLGLEPVAMEMHTTEELATVRLRLAGQGQLAGHTPRPRVPDDAELSVQLHETCINNAFDRLELAGKQFPLEDLFRHITQRLGLNVDLPDDLPENVVIGFEEQEPLRVECRDGLVHVTLRIDSIESGRRDWYDVVAGVSYRLSPKAPQVLLEREGPVRISGDGHRGRFEIALRTVFGKIFPKERPIPLLPEKLASHPRLAELDVVQSVAADGWMAVALAPGIAEAPATVLAPRESTVRK